MAITIAMPMVATSTAEYPSGDAATSGVASGTGATAATTGTAADGATNDGVIRIQYATGEGLPVMPASTSRTRLNSRDLSKK